MYYKYLHKQKLYQLSKNMGQTQNLRNWTQQQLRLNTINTYHRNKYTIQDLQNLKSGIKEYFQEEEYILPMIHWIIRLKNIQSQQKNRQLFIQAQQYSQRYVVIYRRSFNFLQTYLFFIWYSQILYLIVRIGKDYQSQLMAIFIHAIINIINIGILSIKNYTLNILVIDFIQVSLNIIAFFYCFQDIYKIFMLEDNLFVVFYFVGILSIIIATIKPIHQIYCFLLQKIIIKNKLKSK